MHRLSDALAIEMARLAIENIGREYPNAPGHLLRSADDLRSPRELHAESVIMERTTTKPISALGSGLRNLVGILDGSALVLAPDTGPLHMAVALDRPVISLIGYTNPKRTGPYLAPARARNVKNTQTRAPPLKKMVHRSKKCLPSCGYSL